MHVDEHITGAVGLGIEIADLADRLDRIEAPIVEPDGVEWKRPSLGRVSLARATLSLEARSAPYQGLVRAPFTGLRVVATRSVGLADSSAASKVAPLEESTSLAQPPTDAQSVNMEAFASARRTARRLASCGW
jgi:hypothetical protein